MLRCLHVLCCSIRFIVLKPSPTKMVWFFFMVLDRQSHPKWRLTCNKCSSVVSMFEGAVKFRVMETSCPHCQAQIINVDYKVSYRFKWGKNYSD
uniref:Ovule protein n=1 Tax=Angiostrongylus cantonensis TaxID=6313 RepID=A0A0K0DF90_ANGCA